MAFNLIEWMKWNWFPPTKNTYRKSIGDQPAATFPYKKIYADNDEELYGTSIGFCFPWSQAVQARKNGNKTGPVTAQEWEQLKTDTRVDKRNGATSWTNVFRYFDERKRKIELISVDDFREDACRYAALAMKAGAEVYLTLEITLNNIKYGHVECVLAIEDDKIVTNSWGNKAVCTVYPFLQHPYQTTYNAEAAEILLLVIKK